MPTLSSQGLVGGEQFPKGKSRWVLRHQIQQVPLQLDPSYCL